MLEFLGAIFLFFILMSLIPVLPEMFELLWSIISFPFKLIHRVFNSKAFKKAVFITKRLIQFTGIIVIFYVALLFKWSYIQTYLEWIAGTTLLILTYWALFEQMFLPEEKHTQFVWNSKEDSKS